MFSIDSENLFPQVQIACLAGNDYVLSQTVTLAAENDYLLSRNSDDRPVEFICGNESPRSIKNNRLISLSSMSLESGGYMNRLVFLLLFAGSLLSASLRAQSPCEIAMFPFLYDLWNDSGFGRDPNRTERAAWVVRNSAGSFEYIRWKRSSERSKERWKGPVPQNLVAQVHTHPVINDPKPSRGDRKLARKISIPLYTVSGNGIWKVTPDGTVTKIAGDDWFQSMRYCMVK